uniref:Uncharacterized protein n=1 Tax=Rhizophora mucronata TaxID=61149 RepID=A0A2P2N619_RHIMU
MSMRVFNCFLDLRFQNVSVSYIFTHRCVCVKTRVVAELLVYRFGYPG